MRVITGKIEGGQIIDDHLVLRGMIVGDVVVQKNGRLELSGMVVGDVQVESNADLIVRGTINGNILNTGGQVSVFGIVNGCLRTTGGKSWIDPNAIVQRQE